jgi:predicted O-methyltransferase YrrM
MLIPRNATLPPTTDATPIFELFRGAYATELLTVAVAHLHVFEHLEGAAIPAEALAEKTGLEPRAATVLFTALRAMGLLAKDTSGNLGLTPLAREQLLPNSEYSIVDYLGLAAASAGVREMLARLRSNRPAGAPEKNAAADHSQRGSIEEGEITGVQNGSGTAFIYRPDSASAMEDRAAARTLTLALAGRAKNVAPALARVAPLEHARLLLDVGGGTGIYSIACLQRHKQLRAIVWDRPEVLRVAAEYAAEYGVTERLELVPGDMFHDPLPQGADAILLSNILHDWDVPDCQALVRRCAECLPSGGQLLIHDVLLNDALDGPLPIALYSAALFTLTEGRAYSAAEYGDWLCGAGLRPIAPAATAIHCWLIAGTK